ncbi:MAG: hypothetical protein M3347_03650 [Armatimonadota bacterium]|nr:hypothetical protein [Armatimonadota bacterium]
MRKKLNWIEASLLLTCGLLLTGWGIRLYRSEWPAVSVGRFKPVVEDAKFQVLPQPKTIPAWEMKWARQHTRRYKLTTVQTTVWLGHEGARPSWWGERDAFYDHSHRFISNQGQGWFAFNSRGSIAFDTTRQQYVLVREYIIPALPGFTKEGTFWVEIDLRQPMHLSDVSDTAAPIRIVKHYRIPVSMHRQQK